MAGRLYYVALITLLLWIFFEGEFREAIYLALVGAMIVNLTGLLDDIRRRHSKDD